MKTKKLTSFTLGYETIKKLNVFCKKSLTNKSKLVDWLINEHIDKNDRNIIDIGGMSSSEAIKYLEKVKKELCKIKQYEK